MARDDSVDVDWTDWSQADEPEAVEGDWSAATPLCPRCCTEVDQLDHYCNRCMFAVGQFAPYIPFVNIPFVCEPFQIMWERIWLPRGESLARRIGYLAALIIAGLVSGYGWILPIGAWLWWRSPPIPPGHCKSCGYDLRASDQRCPECGMVSSADAESKQRPSQQFRSAP